MARSTRSRVFSLTVGSELTTRETVFAETSASAATSSSVAGWEGFAIRRSLLEKAGGCSSWAGRSRRIPHPADLIETNPELARAVEDQGGADEVGYARGARQA